jgi:hypothetical protein
MTTIKSLTTIPIHKEIPQKKGWSDVGGSKKKKRGGRQNTYSKEGTSPILNRER